MGCEQGGGGGAYSGRSLRIQVFGQVEIIQDVVHTELYSLFETAWALGILIQTQRFRDRREHLVFFSVFSTF